MSAEISPGNKEAFFKRISEVEFTALAFDEINMRNERRSGVDWHDVDISGNFSRNVAYKIPIMGSPMTTVSGWEMGIAKAIEGGASAIPHSLDPEEQRDQVRKVKLHLNGIVEGPITVGLEDKVDAIEKMCLDNKYDFRTFPVIDENGRYSGLMTNSQFKLFRGTDTTAAEAMLGPDDKLTAPSSTEKTEALKMMRERKVGILTLLAADRTVDSLYLVDDVRRVLDGNPERYNLDDNGRLRTVASVSTYTEDSLNRIELMAKYLDLVIIDTSHGEHEYSFEAFKAIKALCKTLKETYSDIDIMVGNVSEGPTAAELAKEGPDAIRIGQGPGGICITRERLGGGCPQGTAIYECSKAVKAIDPEISICADGGIRGPGDVSKAIGLGADYVMVGSLIAATDETPGPILTRPDGTKYKEYNGMASTKEQLRSLAARRRYGDNDPEAAIFTEGIEKDVDVKGPVANIIRDNVVGLKKQMSAAGFARIADLQRGASFWRVSATGAAEGRASS